MIDAPVIKQSDASAACQEELKDMRHTCAATSDADLLQFCAEARRRGVL